MAAEQIKLGLKYNLYTLSQLNDWVTGYGVNSGLDKIRDLGHITQDEADELKVLIDAKIIELSK